jgi:hypothetical protein
VRGRRCCVPASSSRAAAQPRRVLSPPAATAPQHQQQPGRRALLLGTPLALSALLLSQPARADGDDALVTADIDVAPPAPPADTAAALDIAPTAAPPPDAATRSQAAQSAANRAAARPPPSGSTTQGVDVDGRVFLLNADEAAALTLSERQVLILNERIQKQSRVPKDFPSFIREGFDVKVVAPGYSITPQGIIYKDFTAGSGPLPTEGQEVVFNYAGYNESGTSIDSSYKNGRPAQAQLGISTLIPGFDMGLRTMRAGTTRRFIVPPALGPPVGPSTFFSAKQCEVRVLVCVRVRVSVRVLVCVRVLVRVRV